MASNFWFLLLNASIVWGVVCFVLTWVLRIKAVVVLGLLVPFLIAPSVSSIAGMNALISFYGTSLLYGSPGIVTGMIYADYQRAKTLFQRVSKVGFLARGGLTMSALYLLTYFGSNMIMKNQMVKYFLWFVDGGGQAKKLLSFVDQEGAIIAGISGSACIAILIAQNIFRMVMTARAKQTESGAQQETTSVQSQITPKDPA